ncbi:MAG: hypothetical protein IIA01_02475 [Proteobacteria bacterium]|nr:hypothetical protein [Pseudomonadota bacterium]
MTSGRAALNARVVIFQSRAHAEAALAVAAELDTPVVLQSAPGVAAYAGAGYLMAVAERAAARRPDAAVTWVIDCGDDPGIALGALRGGWKSVRFSGRADVLAKLADIAAQQGAELLAGGAPADALDLREAADPHASCRAYLKAG